MAFTISNIARTETALALARAYAKQSSPSASSGKDKMSGAAESKSTVLAKAVIGLMEQSGPVISGSTKPKGFGLNKATYNYLGQFGLLTAKKQAGSGPSERISIDKLV